MKGKFLYRYISFETFVGMVQKNALTFVLPTLWEDPQELAPFYQLIKKTNSGIEYAYYTAIHNKVYAQSWSELAESDAMWRIYAYDNKAIRIRISEESLVLLNGVTAVPVTYSDEKFNCDKIDENVFLTSLAYKRTAFSHEKEVRLIKRYKYRDMEDAELHIKALLVVAEHPQWVEILESMFPDMEPKEKVKAISRLINTGVESKITQDVSYEHIPSFIEGVMVHPLAPDWYVDVVREYCMRNNIPFDGKSELYAVLD